MKIRYIDPKGNIPQSMQNLGYSSSAEFHLKTEADYSVFGISMWRSVVHYLVIPSDDTLPSWLPADLFEIVNYELPSNWFFNYLGDREISELKIELGYKEMVTEKNHYADLIERDEKAIQIFLFRKAEMEKA